MPWDKDPDKAFPARHPREPGGLRQDILDEIADHLACAAEVEGEGQHEGNEDSAWRRALERFGDPDAVARRLWWDAMRETVMREWIQTGVMIVAAAAVIVGVVFMGVMMARVGTANEVMRDAMAQVSASNQAMMQAMEEQRKGNAALLAALSNLPGGADPAPALELSTIELVLRRGSEAGPPALGVRMWLEGKGANDETMTVFAESDADGRARFEKLYQGSYGFKFNDPVSGLSAEETITLFAGRGAGEHVIVVPDVEPRTVHLELDLPAYGRDNEQLIWVDLDGTWKADEETRDIVWRAGGRALLGHFGTWQESSGSGQSAKWPTAASESWNTDALERFTIAGTVSLDDAGLLRRNSEGRWSQQSIRLVSPDKKLILTREDDEGEYYALNNPEGLINEYGVRARTARSLERVTDNTYEEILRDAAIVMEDRLVVDAGGPLKPRMARYRDGQFFESDPGDVGVHSNFSGDGGIAKVSVIEMPEPTAFDSGSNGSVYLALPIDELRKSDLDYGPTPPAVRPDRTTRPEITRPVRLRRMDDLAGNTLLAFAIRAPWDGVAFPSYDGESNVGGLSLDADEEPFWRFSSEALEASRTVGTLFLPLPAELLAEDAAPVTGVMLCWENDTEGYYWALRFNGGHSWVMTEPLPSAGDAGIDRPLNDLDDGRFHYDSIRFGAPELVPSQPGDRRHTIIAPAPSGATLQPKDE